MDFLKLISEGRVEQFETKYGKKFSPEQLKRISKLVQPKYLDWVGKNVDSINFDENFDKLVDAVKKFVLIGSNLPVTDLYQYPNPTKLFQALADYENKARRTIRKVEGGNVVYDDSRFFVVNPLTHESSCYYGKGTKWCTSAESNSHFNRYNEDGKLFYVIDKSLPTNNPEYKIAILKKFDGDESYWNALDETITKGWIFGTDELKKVNEGITNYMEAEYADQLKIWRDKETAKKEKDRLERLRIQNILNQRRADAQERRESGEWDLGPNCPEEGLKAHALLIWLGGNNDVEVKTNEDRTEIQRLKDEIERLENEYDNSEDVRTDLLDEKETLQDELDELESKIDVYNIVPTGTHYDMTEFEVIDSDVDGHRYAVGTQGEVDTSAYDYVESLIDDIGYDGFNQGFARGYIDEEAVASYAEDVYNDDVRDNPESYFDDSERQLSSEQDEKIEILDSRIEQTEALIERLENEMTGDDDSDIEEQIDELNDRITEYKDEIEEIEADPEGEFPDDLIDEKVSDLVSDVRNDPEEFMETFGLNWEDYIDKDDFIEGVISSDGYGSCLSSYDGDVNEEYVQDQLFYVIRID
jgi:predicted nuclease with TOPRIM domain